VWAEVSGFEHDKALTLGRAMPGPKAYSKRVYPRLFHAIPNEVKEQRVKLAKEGTSTHFLSCSIAASPLLCFLPSKLEAFS